MTPQIAQEILDKIVGQVFGYKNPLSLEQFMQKYAFDVRLPMQVNDSTTGEITWAASANPTKFITMANARKRSEAQDLLPTRPLPDIQSILTAWNETNFMSTERQIESVNILECDNITKSENIYRSQFIVSSKNILFSEGCHYSEFLAASQRSQSSTFSIKVDDSQNVTNSFFVTWSNKVTNSFFINDCFDLTDCMFCTNMAGKQYCIANMQFEEEEYRKIKDMVVRWILTN
ncbi:MAG: hypothetical protein JWM37_583 [Candidatus Saccharibacteria bacterium]|nr:hypothetical protein [Candidatus Saccharibacteria bacterium]